VLTDSQNWKSSGFYADAFLNAFPMAVNDIQVPHYSTAEKEIRNCYCLRALDRFLHFLGLAEIEKTPGKGFLSREYRIRRLPLLDEVVHFSD